MSSPAKRPGTRSALAALTLALAALLALGIATGLATGRIPWAGEAWLATEAWRYGFVISYPAEHSPGSTCYKAEPWHLRYMGRDAAGDVRSSGLSLRAWLWGRQAGD